MIIISTGDKMNAVSDENRCLLTLLTCLLSWEPYQIKKARRSHPEDDTGVENVYVAIVTTDHDDDERVEFCIPPKSWLDGLWYHRECIATGYARETVSRCFDKYLDVANVCSQKQHVYTTRGNTADELLMSYLSLCAVLDPELLSKRIQDTYGSFQTCMKLNTFRSMAYDIVLFYRSHRYPKAQKLLGYTHMGDTPHVCDQ
jgi:hypothetical protein